MFAALVDDLAGASIDELDAALAAAKARRDAAELEIAAITAIVDSRQTYRDAGHHSVNAYLKSRLNCSASDARKIKLRARLCNAHPEIGDTLGAGRIGPGQVDLLANAHRHPVVGGRFDEFAALLTEHAEQLDYSDFATVIAHFSSMADPDGTFDDQAFAADRRTASIAVNAGALELHASGGDPIRAVEIKQIFDLACEAEFAKDCASRRDLHGDDALAHPLPRSAEQRRFDAIHEIFLQSVTAPADGKRPEPLVNLIVDVTTGLEVLARHGLLDLDGGLDVLPAAGPVDPSTRRCGTSTGTPVHPDEALKAMLRGSIRRVVVDADEVTINLGRAQRLFTGKAREAARLLTVRCRFRGCDVPAEFCDIDHIDEWAAHHGATDQANALPLCGSHDRWKHRQHLRGRRDRHGRIHLVRPDGSVVKPLGARDPEWAVPAWQGRTTTWAEFTTGSATDATTTRRRRCSPPPDAVVTIVDRWAV